MTSSPREAEARIGPVGAFLSRVLFSALFLPGPVLLYAAGRQSPQESPADFWGLLAGGVLMTIIGGGFAVFGLRLVARSRSDARRLATAGVAATAEVLAVEHHLGGEDSGLKLRIRVSGNGFAAFEAETIRPEDPALVPGAVLAAVVDPAGPVFSVH